jgi:hypothetical protein
MSPKSAPAPTASAPPLRILCLHGQRQTGQLFRDRISRLAAQLVKLQLAELNFVDGPIVLPTGDGSATLRGWYGDEAEELTAPFEALRSHWASGQYDGVLGFSAGGLAAAVVATSPTHFPSCRFAICASAPAQPAPSAWAPAASKARIPSLHLFSADDLAVPAADSRALIATWFDETQVHADCLSDGLLHYRALIATWFDETQVHADCLSDGLLHYRALIATWFDETQAAVHEHPKGHALPCRTADVAAVVGFLTGVQRAQPPSPPPRSPKTAPHPSKLGHTTSELGQASSSPTTAPSRAPLPLAAPASSSSLSEASSRAQLEAWAEELSVPELMECMLIAYLMASFIRGALGTRADGVHADCLSDGLLH